MIPAKPDTSTPAPSYNLNASAAAVATWEILKAAFVGAGKRRHRIRLRWRLEEACSRLEGRGSALNIWDKEPQAQAQARVDAAAALRFMLAELAKD